MAVLRLPNPGSDLDRFVSTFALISRESNDKNFGLDFMTEVMTKNFQASSMGAHGDEAVRLSTREDRTRDPLFNQSKMYSELYRMLGWIRSHESSHSNFKVSPLGSTITHYFSVNSHIVKGLVAESFVSVVFPNPSTINIGILNHRPFAQILKLAYLLNGVITRDEIIIGVLSIMDDLESNVIENNVKLILKLREKDKTAASSLVSEIAKSNSLQVNTLENYTRLPIAILASEYLGWGKGVYSESPYLGSEKSRVFYLSDLGNSKAQELLKSCDLRIASLNSYSVEDRAWLANYGYYSMAFRSGIKDAAVNQMIQISRGKIQNILSVLGIEDPNLLIFNPSLQENDEVLSVASNLSK